MSAYNFVGHRVNPGKYFSVRRYWRAATVNLVRMACVHHGGKKTLHDPFGHGHMGITAENLAAKWTITREEQDALAVESQRRAAAAIAEGRF